MATKNEIQVKNPPLLSSSKNTTEQSGAGSVSQGKLVLFPPQQRLRVVNRLITFLEAK